MPVTGVRGRQILDGDVTRSDLNVDTAGQAVIRRIIAGNGISISSTGVDSGTGDVTITSTNILNGTGFVRMSGTTINYDTTVFVTGDYYAPNATFGQRPLRSQIVDNVLFQADSRFNVTRTDTGARIGNSLFNGIYDQGGFTIAAGTTLTFNLNFTANSNSSVTYTEGSVYLHFYYTSIPQSVSGRVKDSGGTWRNITNWTNISLSGGLAVWRGSVPGFNYMTDMEITITAQASINTQFNQWEYVQSRPGQYEWGIISKLQANNLWTNLTFRNATNTSVITLEAGTGNITANAFIKTGGTSAQFLKADGSVDTNTYLTTNLYNSNGTLTGNRTVTMGGNSLTFSGGVLRVNVNSTNGALIVNGGDTNVGFIRASIAFGYDTSQGYYHWIHSRHNGGTGVNNALDFYTSNGTENGTFPTNAIHGMTITNGSVGIGTTSPTTKLEAVDSNAFLRFSNISNTPTLEIGRSSSSGWTDIAFQGQEQKIRSNNSGEFQFYGAGGGWGLYTWVNNGTEKMRLTTSGNLLIGTTTMSSVYTTAELVLNDSSGYTYQEIRGANQSTLALTTGTSVGATPAVEIYNSYNFGIKFMQTSESTFLMFYHGTNKYLSIDTNSNERMRITSDGDVGIGTTTPGARLHSDYTPTWTGNSRISYYGALRQTVPASSTLNSGHTISASVSYLETTLQGSSTINAGAIFGGFVGINRVSFTAASSTLTMNSSAGSNLRAYSAMQVLMQTGGTNAGTITHGASLFVQGVYPINTTVVTFTNYYGLLINDLTEWGTVAITNRWGIYQAGASDRNYFAGDTTFNRLAGTGTRMVVVDANGQLSTQAIPSGGGGVTTLNTLTAATQTFAVGTSGTDFNISSSTSTHTFNIPDASLTARGLITTGAQTISGNKIIRGTSTLNTEFALIVQNSAGTMLFQVRNDGGNVTVPSELRATGGISTNQITTFSSGNVNFPAQINTVNISIGNNSNIILATANGSKIGTATNQKLGFWNATPIVQPTTGSAAAAFVANTGTAVNDASTFDGYTMRQVVKALRDMGLLA